MHILLQSYIAILVCRCRNKLSKQGAKNGAAMTEQCFCTCKLCSHSTLDSYATYTDQKVPELTAQLLNMNYNDFRSHDNIVLLMGLCNRCV